MRSQFSHHISQKYGAFPLLDSSLFSDFNQWKDQIKKIKDTYKDQDEVFITYLKDNYADEIPHIWANVEILSFGDLIRWLYLLDDNKVKDSIFKTFDIKSPFYITFRLLKNIKAIRNYCAHYSRLWNRAFKNAIPKLNSINSQYNKYWNTDRKESRKKFNSLIIIDHLLNSIKINYNIIEKTYKLANKYEIIELEYMGFPNNFKKTQ